MAKMRIGVDMDGVLADFVKGFRRVANTMWPGRIPPGCEPTGWHLTGLGLSGSEVSAVWVEIMRTRDFWLKLSPYEDVLRDMPLERLSEAPGVEVYILTTRFPTAGDSVEEQTRKWLEDHGIMDGRDPTIVVTSGHRAKVKAMNRFGIHLHIDDYHETARLARKASPCRPYLLTRPWNRDAGGLDRVDSVSEFSDVALEFTPSRGVKE